MVVICDKSCVELRSLNFGDVFDLQEKSVHHYYIIIHGDYCSFCNHYSDCLCVNLENGELVTFAYDTLVFPVSAQLMVKGKGGV